MNEESSSATIKNEFTPLQFVIRFLFTAVLMLGVLFLSAGTFRWWEAWVYVGVSLPLLFASRVLIYVKSPDLVLERAGAGAMEDVKEWDRVLVPIIAIYGPIITWIVAGLDHRFSWSPDLPVWIQLFALALFILGNLIATWAMVVNRFFSSHVRIQTDRSHSVIKDGPYRVVRHPGYAGGLLFWIAAPFFFSSYWLIVPVVLVIGLTFVRTYKEDQTLCQELPGYEEYAGETRYRLIPGIW